MLRLRNGARSLAGKACTKSHAANMEDASLHCKRGHEFTPENTGRANKKRGRYCRTCVIAATRARNARLDSAKEKARLHESYLRKKARLQPTQSQR